jgi:hypothetical protein
MSPESGKIIGQDNDFSEDRIASALPFAFFAAVAAILAAPLFSRLSWMIFIQDDFLYYLTVAQNIAHGAGSTFNHIVPTNGYQPLWLIIFVGLSWLTTTPKLILAALAITDFLAALATFILARKLLRTSGVRPLAIFIFAALVTLYSVTLFFYGMEVTLTVPIVLGVLCLLRNVAWLERGPFHTLSLGLLLSAMVLSRIDTLILGGLVLAGILISRELRVLLRPRLVFGALFGLLPLVAYFFFNHLVFHTWLPVSGMAKELKFTHTPSLEPWRVFFHLLAASFTAIILIAVAALPAVRNRLTAMERVLYPAALVFPFLYYFILSCVSDWTLWGWYMYPIRISICVSFVILCLHPRFAALMQHRAVMAVLLVSVFVWLGLMRWTHQQTDIYAASLEIQQFSETHPGIYAMGDRAGRVGYLISDSVIQTEGLMMDREYLEYVRRQTPLLDTLAHYNVRYYVATAYQPYTGCFEAIEPAKAGPESAHMRAELCEPPLAVFSHEGIQTLIFDLQQRN